MCDEVSIFSSDPIMRWRALQLGVVYIFLQVIVSGNPVVLDCTILDGNSSTKLYLIVKNTVLLRVDHRYQVYPLALCLSVQLELLWLISSFMILMVIKLLFKCLSLPTLITSPKIRLWLQECCDQWKLIRDTTCIPHNFEEQDEGKLKSTSQNKFCWFPISIMELHNFSRDWLTRLIPMGGVELQKKVIHLNSI
jgi:hypothetical protein